MENNQEDFLYKKEEKEDPIYVMTVELEKGKSETIKIFQNSKPEFLAYEFCKKHNLDFNSLSYLTNKIKELLETIPNQTIEIRKSISINNEPIEELDEEYNPPSEILLKKSIGSFNKKISTNSNENLNSDEKNSNNDDKIEKNLENFSNKNSNNDNKNFEEEILNSESNKNCESKENFILNMNVENQQNKLQDNNNNFNNNNNINNNNINNNNNDNNINIKIDENLNNNFENKNNINNFFKNKNLKSSFQYSNIYLFLEKKLKKEEEKRKKIEEENNFNNNDDYNIYDNINTNNNNKNKEIFKSITKENRNKLFNYKKFYENFKENIQLKNNSIQNHSNFIENNSSNLNILNENNNNNNNNLINYSNNENYNISYNNINKLNNNNFINDSKIQITSKSVDKKLKNFNKKKSSSKIITLSQNNNNFDNFMNKNYAIFDEIYQAKVEDLNLFKKKPKHILKSKSESNKKIFFDDLNNEKKNKLKSDFLKKNNKTNFIFASNFNFFSPQNVKKNVKYLKNNINYINKYNKNKIINTSKSSRNFEKNKENKKKLFSPFLYENKKEKLLNENSKCSTKSNSYKNKIISSYRNYYSNDSKINLNDYQIENMFIKIFKLLDKDNDNKINILNMDIKDIPTSIYNLIISPIINKLKIRNNEINLKDFCEIGINKFKYFPVKKKKILINFTNNL